MTQKESNLLYAEEIAVAVVTRNFSDARNLLDHCESEDIAQVMYFVCRKARSSIDLSVFLEKTYGS